MKTNIGGSRLRMMRDEALWTTWMGLKLGIKRIYWCFVVSIKRATRMPRRPLQTARTSDQGSNWTSERMEILLDNTSRAALIDQVTRNRRPEKPAPRKASSLCFWRKGIQSIWACRSSSHLLYVSISKHLTNRFEEKLSPWLFNIYQLYFI